MSSRAVVVAAALVVLAAPAGAQLISDTHVFYAVAHTEGAGNPPTRWVSDVTVHNPHAAPLTVGFQLFVWGESSSYDPSYPVRITLAPRQTRTLGDVVAGLFGRTDDLAASLLVSCDEEIFAGNPENAVVIGTARTYNVGSPDGTFGQTVPSTDELRNCGADPSFVTGARHDARFRSNLGIANAAFDANTIHYRVLGPAGEILAQGSDRYEAFDARQRSLGALGVPLTDGPLTVEVWLDPADVSPTGCDGPYQDCFAAWVSKVDGNPDGTGDAEFIVAVPPYDPPVCEDE